MHLLIFVPFVLQFYINYINWDNVIEIITLITPLIQIIWTNITPWLKHPFSCHISLEIPCTHVASSFLCWPQDPPHLHSPKIIFWWNKYTCIQLISSSENVYNNYMITSIQTIRWIFCGSLIVCVSHSSIV